MASSRTTAPESAHVQVHVAMPPGPRSPRSDRWSPTSCMISFGCHARPLTPVHYGLPGRPQRSSPSLIPDVALHYAKHRIRLMVALQHQPCRAPRRCCRIPDFKPMPSRSVLPAACRPLVARHGVVVPRFRRAAKCRPAEQHRLSRAVHRGYSFRVNRAIGTLSWFVIAAIF